MGASKSRFQARRIALILLTCCASVMSGTCVNAQESPIPDFYEDAGVNKDRQLNNDYPNEAIDPFSGTLTLVHTDLTIPGNGGLDIEIKRVYSNLQGKRVRKSAFGMGWTLHFGRVILGAIGGVITNACEVGGLSTLDNAVLELSDGSRQILVDGKLLDFTPTIPNPYQVTLITNQFWKAECLPDGASLPDGTPSQGLAIYSPTGMRYDMGYSTYHGGSQYLYPTRITNPSGMSMSLRYIELGPKDIAGVGYETGIDTIDTSDGRHLRFTYTNPDTLDALLQSIEEAPGFPTAPPMGACAESTPNYRYEYSFQLAETYFDVPYYQLTQVRRPDGTTWDYSYYSASEPQAYNAYSLKSLRYPHGGQTDYSYQHVNFDGGNTISPYTVSIASKTTHNPATGPLSNPTGGPATGVWTWTFLPGGGFQNRDITIESNPLGSTQYSHHGYMASLYRQNNGLSSQLWGIGQLMNKTTVENDVTVEYASYNRTGTVISAEIYQRPTRAYNQTLTDPYMLALYTQSQSIIRGGIEYRTDYTEHDLFNNPLTVIETGNPVSVPDTSNIRTTRNSYWFDYNLWIVKQLEDETLDGVLVRDRRFDFRGRLNGLTEKGATTSWQYDADGNINLMTDGNGNTTTYSDYYRGIARTETQPGNINVYRYVNKWGTVAGLKNGRGHTTCYAYDDFNRLAMAQPPANSAINITRTASTQTVSRGAFSELTEYDGYGLTAKTVQQDTTLGGASITHTMRYDALGRKVFESHPNSSDGTAFSYDILGRPTSVSYADGKSLRYEYLPGNLTFVTDERGYTTLYQYLSFGDPNEQLLVYKQALVDKQTGDSARTEIERAFLGQVTRVSIDAVHKTFGYDRATTLMENRHGYDEGGMQFAYDGAGNLTCRVVLVFAPEASCWQHYLRTEYVYDDRARMLHINYPDGTPDVDFSYDENDNLTRVDNGTVSVAYSYDANDNLSAQTTTTGAESFTFRYQYNANDHLEKIIYPSGLVVDYKPDVLGRPTQAQPFISSVSYHANGIPNTVAYSNGYTARTTLHPRLWVASRKHSGVNALPGFDYAYDESGNITSIADVNDPRYNVSLGYDGLSRIISADGYWGNLGFSYSEHGNIASKTLNGVTFDYQYRLGQLRHISNLYPDPVPNVDPDPIQYDRMGNTTHMGDRRMQYDEAYNLTSHWREVAGQIVDGSSVSHGYDGNKRRVITTSDAAGPTYFVYSKNDTLLLEKTLNPEQLREYVYLGKQLVGVNLAGPTPSPAVRSDLNGDRRVDSRDLGILMSAWGTTGPPGDIDANGSVNQADMQLLLDDRTAPGEILPEVARHFYHTDLLGSPIAASDEAGNILWIEIYAPFGETQLKQAANTQQRGHTGHYQDKASGLIYAGARFYDPIIGRFLTVDPATFNPEDYNDFARYNYAANNPYRYVDPDGREEDPVLGTLSDDIYTPLGQEVLGALPVVMLGGSVGGVALEAASLVTGIPALSPRSWVKRLFTNSAASQLAKNKAAGDAFEKQVMGQLQQTQSGVVQQVTVKTQSGVRTRIDLMGRDANGNIVCTECKASANAPLTRNQTAAFPEIQQTGATVVGQGRPGFPGGTQIPPTTINIVRP